MYQYTPLHQTNPSKYQLGLTIVELMVSLAISALLIAGVSSLYFDARQTDRVGNDLARIQETGRFALEFMARDIRMAGYQGCADPETLSVNIIADNPPTNGLIIDALRGYEVDDTSWADGTEYNNQAIETKALITSDVIAIQRAETANTQLTGNMTANNANVQITVNPLGFQQNDVVVIADCENADMFRISSTPQSTVSGNSHVTLAHADNVNSDNKLSTLYDTSAKVMYFRSMVYFVGNTGRTNTLGQPIYALYRQSDNRISSTTTSFDIQELVEGVESMQITYGERLSSGNIRFVPADTAGLVMTNVESVRISLLVTSTNEVLKATDNQEYVMAGVTIKPSGTSGAEVTHAIDKRIRRTFSATINLRNRQ